jgi:hypothetical protein
MRLIGAVYAPFIPYAPPYRGNHIQYGDKKQGRRIKKRQSGGSAAVSDKGKNGKGKTEKLTASVAHKYFCLWNGRVKNKETQDRSGKAKVQQKNKSAGRSVEDKGEEKGGKDGNASGKAVHPVDKINRIGNAHYPEKGKEELKADGKYKAVRQEPAEIGRIKELTEHITGNDDT